MFHLWKKQRFHKTTTNILKCLKNFYIHMLYTGVAEFHVPWVNHPDRICGDDINNPCITVLINNKIRKIEQEEYWECLLISIRNGLYLLYNHTTDLSEVSEVLKDFLQTWKYIYLFQFYFSTTVMKVASYWSRWKKRITIKSFQQCYRNVFF